MTRDKLSTVYSC